MGSLTHDWAFVATQEIMKIITPVVMPSEFGDVFRAVYEAMKDSLEAYEMMKAREARRLRPSRN